MNNLVQIRDEDEESDDDEEKVEIDAAGEKLAKNETPLDFHFVHLAFEEGAELIKLEDNKGVPLNFRFWIPSLTIFKRSACNIWARWPKLKAFW